MDFVIAQRLLVAKCFMEVEIGHSAQFAMQRYILARCSHRRGHFATDCVGWLLVQLARMSTKFNLRAVHCVQTFAPNDEHSALLVAYLQIEKMQLFPKYCMAHTSEMMGGQLSSKKPFCAWHFPSCSSLLMVWPVALAKAHHKHSIGSFQRMSSHSGYMPAQSKPTKST